MIKRMRIIALAMAWLLAMAQGYASVTIHGKVTQEENEPLEFVAVKVKGTALGTMTNLNGDYTLTVADTDTLRLVFSCIGYEEANRRLIEPKGEVTVNVKMTPKSYSLGGVEVTEIRKQVGQMQDINIDNYRLAPDVSGGSVESMISTMAGVASSNEMSSQYSVRGGTYDENSVYINGVEVYRPLLVTSGQQEGLSIINPDLVGSVKFSTGGFPAQYADKMSSALDITYREPEAFEGTVGASLMGGNVAIGASSRHFSMLHGVRYKANSSLLSSMEDKGEYDPRYFDYQTSMTWKASDKFKASFLGNIAINDYKFVPATRETSFGTSTDAKQFKVYFDGQEKDKFETFFGALNLTYSPNKANHFSLLTSGFLTNELVSYDISGEYWLDQAGGSDSEGSTVGGELGVGKYLEHARNRLKASVFSIGLRGVTGLNGHTLEYGMQFNHEKITERSREWELHDSAGYSLPLNPDVLQVFYNSYSDNEIASNRYSFYAQDTYRLDTSAGYLNVNGGIRLSYWDFNKEFLVSPRITATFVPSKAPRWSFRFATGLYYQSPFFKEYRMPVVDELGNTIIELNRDIKSQRSFQFIFGTDYTFRAWGRPFKLSGEAYYKILGNLIPYEVDNLKVVYTGVNSSSGYTMGLDFKLFGQFVPGSDSWISFSLMKTQEDLNGVKVPRPTDRRYNFAIYFTDFFPNYPKLKFSLRGILSDGIPTTSPRLTRDQSYFRMPAYKRLDIGFSYALLSPRAEGEPRRSGIAGKLKGVWLGLDVFNLLDISNVSSYYWVTDVNGIQYAVPNYLTRRQLNVRLTVDF
ncbi:MAG: carboxypeptidase-like regulatory domain-containing protein [Bacteroidales bacterium]|nr:carboxypeptidase-like regulatory domain-containing protein [Bacteroidales bacterium]